MELFKITCVTCSARLSVRDAALVGHILACPRCGSMVQVTAPTASAPAASPSHVTPSAALSLATASVFDVADVGASLENGETPVAPADALPAPADPKFETAGSSGLKLGAIVLAGALAGSAVVVGVLAWVSGEEAPPSAAQEEKTVVAPVAEVEPPDNDAAPVVEQSPPASAAVEDEVERPAVTAETDESTGEEPASKEPEAAATAPPPVPQPPGEEGAAPAAAVATRNGDPPPAAAPAPRLRIDPLEIDPEGLDLSTLFRPRADEPLAVSEVNEPMADAVDSDAPSEPVDGARGDDAPSDRQAVRRDADGGGAPGDVAALLARRLPRVKVDEMPLCRFVDLAGQLSGLPVSVDPRELRLASASAGAAVSVDAKEATIEEIVAAAVKPLKLAVVVENSQLVLRRPGGDKRRTTACPVDDLVGGNLTADELAGWVQQMVAPDSWAMAGGSGTLKVAGETLEIEQREDVTYEAFILLERYRLVRGLPTRTKYPAALLTPGDASDERADRLAAPTTFTFSQYTPLREIFRWWQEELEVAVLVDWPALAGERLWPQTRIATSAINQPWSEALDQVLEPLGLAWRPAGARAIQITTLAKVRTEPVVELYRLSDSSSTTAEELAQQVEKLTAAGAQGSASQEVAAVNYDAAHRVLLVRAPASVQRRFGEWLQGQ